MSALLDLGGDGEFIVFLWQALAILFHDFANRNSANDGRGNHQTFDHVLLQKKKAPGGMGHREREGDGCGKDGQLKLDTRKTAEIQAVW
ncbi:hypothetical protein AX13_12330 [Comamonas aquatica DA1877]|uniref:Uncharacterized protein n=1 Tax=Comamonas aquatica DA1877 TaxID=1457173 RepID=A0A014M9P4_9BURK|nr:hypothetical protein AX13_12330 [Comamonas aquatica DA1877]